MTGHSRYLSLRNVVAVDGDGGKFQFLKNRALGFAALVSKSAEGFTGCVGSLLRWSVLRYIGRISYGMYLYHFLALLIIARVCKKLGTGFPEAGVNRFVVAGILTVLMAALSWHLFERPINQLKRLFPYREAGTGSSMDPQVSVAAREHC